MFESTLNLFSRYVSTVGSKRRYHSMVGHLFQNYDTIYVRFFPTYTFNHSWYTIYVRFFVTYTCVLIPSIWPLSYKRIYMRTIKPIYMRYKQACGICDRRKSSYKRHRIYSRPFVSKLWHDIRAVFSHVYSQSFLLHDIRAFFLSRILAFYSQVYDPFLTNAHIYALQTSMWYMGLQKVVV